MFLKPVNLIVIHSNLVSWVGFFKPRIINHNSTLQKRTCNVKKKKGNTRNLQLKHFLFGLFLLRGGLTEETTLQKHLSVCQAESKQRIICHSIMTSIQLHPDVVDSYRISISPQSSDVELPEWHMWTPLVPILQKTPQQPVSGELNSNTVVLIMIVIGAHMLPLDKGNKKTRKIKKNKDTQD